MMKGKVAELKKQMDSEEYGGAPFLGRGSRSSRPTARPRPRPSKTPSARQRSAWENDLCGTMQAALDDVAAANAAAAQANQTEN